MRGISLALLCCAFSVVAADAPAQLSGPRAPPPPSGAQLIKPPGPQNLERPNPGAPPAMRGAVFCPGGDMVVANDRADEAKAGAKPYPCSGTLYLFVCHGTAGQYGVFVHDIPPGRHREIETPAGSTYDAQCDTPPPRQCPARFCVGP